MCFCQKSNQGQCLLDFSWLLAEGQPREDEWDRSRLKKGKKRLFIFPVILKKTKMCSSCNPGRHTIDGLTAELVWFDWYTGAPVLAFDQYRSHCFLSTVVGVVLLRPSALSSVICWSSLGEKGEVLLVQVQYFQCSIFEKITLLVAVCRDVCSFYSKVRRCWCNHLVSNFYCQNSLVIIGQSFSFKTHSFLGNGNQCNESSFS